MPRRVVLSAAERGALLAIPTDEGSLIRHYTLDAQDLALVQQRRGDHNRLGFAVHLCSLRFPGYALPHDSTPPAGLLAWVARQLDLEPGLWPQYARRAETRREHLRELQFWLGLTPFGRHHFRSEVEHLTLLAAQTDRGIALATALVERLRQQRVVLPPIDVIERVCAHALIRGTQRVYDALTAPLTSGQLAALDRLLQPHEGARGSTLAWLRQPPGAPNARHILAHLDRLQVIRDLGLPDRLEQAVHQNRLLKLAREGGQMTGQHLRELEPLRRHATLVAVVLETRATVIDESIDLHDRFFGTLFARAKRTHAEQLQQTGQTIGDQVQLFFKIGRALLAARASGQDPFSAIEAIVSWDELAARITAAEQLTGPDRFDFLSQLTDGYPQLRRYTPRLLETLQLTAAPAARELLRAVETLKTLNERQARKVPDDAPTVFVRQRWRGQVITDQGIDRRFYELCVLAELRNALRSGDLWVRGSRQFKDFEAYLLSAERFAALQEQSAIPLAVSVDSEAFLQERIALLKRELETVDRLATATELPDATLTERGLRVTLLEKAVPPEADSLLRQASALLPHLKITDLLLEVDDWTGFSHQFTHLKSGESAPDRSLLLTAILADAINLGLAKQTPSREWVHMFAELPSDGLP